jgi:hypothetical protein
MNSQFEESLSRFADDFVACHQVVSGRSFTLEVVEEVLKQQAGESDFSFAGRCIGVFNAYAFAAANLSKFQELGFITSPNPAITPELMFALYLFFGGTETPRKADEISLDLFINAVRQRQQNRPN